MRSAGPICPRVNCPQGYVRVTDFQWANYPWSSLRAEWSPS